MKDLGRNLTFVETKKNRENLGWNPRGVISLEHNNEVFLMTRLLLSIKSILKAQILRTSQDGLTFKKLIRS